MSYCRWSSMNWRCDVYVYCDSEGGWTTEVAELRRIIPPIPNLPYIGFGNWLYRWAGGESHARTWRRWIYDRALHFASFWRRRIHMPSVGRMPLRKIGLPYDGEIFNDPTPLACADRLERLRSLGYRVPQHAIDALRAEAAE